MGTWACPGSPLCLTNVSVFAEDPQSREFPLHHYSGLGIRTVQNTHFLFVNIQGGYKFQLKTTQIWIDYYLLK